MRVVIVSKQRLRKIIKYVLPTICWAGLIFFFSSQTYQEQRLIPYIERIVTNDQVRALLSPISFQYHSREISVQNLGVAHFIEFFIRKFAHLFVFFVLGCLTVRAALIKIERPVLASMVSLFFVFIYAALDELHQMYTGGRTPLFTDVCIDTVGGVLGIFIYLIIFKKRTIA